MSGTLAFGCDECDMYLVNASLKPLRQSNEQLKQLELLAIKAADAIEQENENDDSNSNEQSKGPQLKPVNSSQITDDDDNNDDDSDDEEEPKQYRSFQYNTQDNDAADAAIGNMMSKLMFMSNRFDHKMFLGFNDGKFRRAWKYLSSEDMNKIVECSSKKEKEERHR